MSYLNRNKISKIKNKILNPQNLSLKYLFISHWPLYAHAEKVNFVLNFTNYSIRKKLQTKLVQNCAKPPLIIKNY